MATPIPTDPPPTSTAAPVVEITDAKSFYAVLDAGTKNYMGKVPVATAVGWFGPRDATGAAVGLTFFQLPQRLTDGTARAVPMSIDPFSVPIAIFQDDGMIRIYTLPAVVPTPRPAEWTDRAPRRFTLSKAAPTMVIEEMPLGVMAELIIDEWTELAEGMSGADVELERVIALVEGLEPEQPVGANSKEWLRKDDLIEALETREHREVDDSDGGDGADGDDGDDGDEPKAPAPPA
jgi:hypothetical protein